jgi:NitT/TauT family transport system substrate-binding protein
VEYITFNNSAERLALLISGGLDIDAGNLNAGILNVLSQEPNIKVVADRGHAQPGECTYQGILVRKDLFESGQITDAAGLKGQVISSSTTGTTGFFLSNYLAQANLTLKDVTISDIPNAGEIDAFANKTLGAIVATEPDITRILNAGNAVLLVGSQDAIGTFQSSLMTFGKHLVVDDREAGARFLAGYLKGVRQYNEGKTERNLQIIAEATGESIDLLKAACWVPVRDDGLIDFASVDALQKWLIEQKQLDKPVTQAQFWDPSFLDAAMKLLNP